MEPHVTTGADVLLALIQCLGMFGMMMMLFRRR